MREGGGSWYGGYDHIRFGAALAVITGSINIQNVVALWWSDWRLEV